MNRDRTAGHQYCDGNVTQQGTSRSKNKNKKTYLMHLRLYHLKNWCAHSIHTECGEPRAKVMCV